MDKGLKSATIEKKIAWLNAAVNLAIKENKLKFNPFAGIIPKLDDAERRLPLDDRRHEGDPREPQTTRQERPIAFAHTRSNRNALGEAFEIDSEEKERGVRFVMVGPKNEQSTPRAAPGRRAAISAEDHQGTAV